jgi:hypothetical protein
LTATDAFLFTCVKGKSQHDADDSKQRRKLEGKIKRASRVSPGGCMCLEKSNVRAELEMCLHIAVPFCR